MSTEEERLHEFLSEIQLEQFYYLIVRNLHVTRIAHLDHVVEADLTEIDMSKPEQRRLFDHLKKSKRLSFKKFLKKSLKRDPEKRHSISPPKESDLSPEATGNDASAVNNPLLIARNNIQQGLKCLIQQKDLVLGDFLGKGAFGYVRKGIWTSEKGLEINVAVKCLKPNHDEATVMLQGEFIKEANAMSKLDHPNLIRLYGIVLTTPMMLVTELAPVGSLLNRLRREPNKFMISILCSFVVQIVSGMKYLEVNRFIHRDLAARNILLVSYEKIKIGDFGLMRALPSDADYYVMQPNGLVPFAWCATECLKYRRFSHASDVWAFGVTLIELFSYGQEPWPGLNGAEILEKIDAPNFLRPERPAHCPMEVYKIMKNHCWSDNPEERSSFETLEKMILEVLPKEIQAPCDFYAQNSDQLSFKTGDPLTIIESSHDGTLVKSQNRRNGKVGYIPVSLLSGSSTGGKVSEAAVKAHQSSHVSSQIGKTPSSGRGRLLEPDTVSVASRGSSSSSGSNSSSETGQQRHSQSVKHSRPKDIPFRRQSTFSSGVGSSGPSCPSSYKEETVPRKVSESDYGSQDDSSSLSSGRNVAARHSANEVEKLSFSPYENTGELIEDSNPYENTAIGSPNFHSKPISIPKRGHECSTRATMPVDTSPKTFPSHQRISPSDITSLPCHDFQLDTVSCALNVSGKSETVNALSTSAPTTRSEIKAIRSTVVEQKSEAADEFISEVADEFSPRSSFGSYKQKPTAIKEAAIYRFADNLVYESMVSEGKLETYESMERRSTGFKSSALETYENIEPIKGQEIVDQGGEICYENVTINPYEEIDESEGKPVLPEKTYRNVESKMTVPPRTYRQSSDDSAKSSSMSKSYENTLISVPPRTYRHHENVTSTSLPARTYRRCSADNYENNEIVRTRVPPAPRPYENYTLNRSSGSGKYRSDSSYENYDINLHLRSLSSNSYENYDFQETADSPPPLPKKKSSRSESECSFSPSDRELRSSSRLSIEEPIIESPVIESQELKISEAKIIETEPRDPNNRNLIDDSPVHKQLPTKYGTIWDGQECTKDVDSADDFVSPVTHEVACDQLVSVAGNQDPSTKRDVTSGNVDPYLSRKDEVAQKECLLRALLSPNRDLRPRLDRAQSDESPIPPPRKHRDNTKSSRRHTVSTMSSGKTQKDATKLLDHVAVDSQIEALTMPSQQCADLKSFGHATEDSTIGPQLSNEPYDFASSKHTALKSDSTDSLCEADSNAPPLPPRVPSEIRLRRENSDYVEIDMVDGEVTDSTAQINDIISEDLKSEIGVVLTEEKNAVKVVTISEVKKQADDSEEKISSEEDVLKPAQIKERSSEGQQSEPAKAENGKSKFSRIKSLLSGKVSTQDLQPTSSDATTASTSKTVDDSTAIEVNIENGDDDDEIRYVLHFVTPV